MGMATIYPTKPAIPCPYCKCAMHIVKYKGLESSEEGSRGKHAFTCRGCGLVTPRSHTPKEARKILMSLNFGNKITEKILYTTVDDVVVKEELAEARFYRPEIEEAFKRLEE